MHIIMICLRPHCNSTFKVVSIPLQPTFEGIIGPSYQSDIAIDDILITNGACSGTNGGCNFEQDMCTWTNTRVGDDFDWLRKMGSTISTATGPASDHTIGTFLGKENSNFLI